MDTDRTTTPTAGGPTAGAQESCPDCHALVADLDAHEHWHSRLTATLATAVVKEMNRRAPV